MSDEDAENIVQDLFVYLWENLGILDTLSNPNAFLFTLIKNRCIDFLRRKNNITNKKVPVDLQTRELYLKFQALQQFDENALSANDIEKILNEAINKLPPKCKEVFILSRMEGLKHQEIAMRLDISARTVQNHIISALGKLKILLKDYLPLYIFFL